MMLPPDDAECLYCKGRGWTWTLDRGYENCPGCDTVRIVAWPYDWQARGDL